MLAFVGGNLLEEEGSLQSTRSANHGFEVSVDALAEKEGPNVVYFEQDAFEEFGGVEELLSCI